MPTDTNTPEIGSAVYDPARREMHDGYPASVFAAGTDGGRS